MTNNQKFTFILGIIQLLSAFVHLKSSVPKPLLDKEPIVYNDKIILRLVSGYESIEYLPEFDKIKELLIDFEYNSYLDDRIIKALSSKSVNSRNSKILDLCSKLNRYIVLTHKTNINPYHLSRKLKGFNGIESAEPMPIVKLGSISNDSLADFLWHIEWLGIDKIWDEARNLPQIILAIVDTGIDYYHEDLLNSIWINSGETGMDQKGNDKSSNGIDDDSNGFIDDWQGWDFSSSFDQSNSDNDPFAGNEHGTHVAGIAGASINNNIGIAGVAPNIKLLNVKIGSDDPMDEKTYNSYNGILYSALMGAKVINCSWGTSARTEADTDVLDLVNEMGCLIVASAGNDGKEITYFPAGYKSVMAVASTNPNDRKSVFSNFHTSLDICAPGLNIMSTIKGNKYNFKSGTSMSTPIVSAVAALLWSKYPEMTNTQILEHLKATSFNIDTINSQYYGKIGRGRLDPVNAMSSQNVKSISLNSFNTYDENSDNLLDPDEFVELDFTAINVLSPVVNCYVKIRSLSEYDLIFEKDSIYLGNLSTLQEFASGDKFIFYVPSEIPKNHKGVFEFKFYDDSGYINNHFVEMTFRPSYRTMSGNKITATFNSIGNIAYNDYPTNSQGDGFSFEGSSNLLFEGALMVGTSVDKLSNVARGFNQTAQDQSFLSEKVFTIENNKSGQFGYTSFIDTLSSDNIGISIAQNVFQFNEPRFSNLILIKYIVKNISTALFDSLFLSLFMDWDIGPAGTANRIEFDRNKGIGIIEHVSNSNLPKIATALVSEQNLNFFAIDNGGSATSPGVWNGFSRSEKWLTMSSGLRRLQSNTTDVSCVIGAGPIKLEPGQYDSVSFAIYCGYSSLELSNISDDVRSFADFNGIGKSKFIPIPNADTLHLAFPNPVDLPWLAIEFAVSSSSIVKLSIFNSIGDEIVGLRHEDYFQEGIYYHEFDVSSLSPGRYFVRMESSLGIDSIPFEVAK